MTKGAVALVLHAHLPYVRSAQPGSLEEDWFFQALIECYLPLLETLERQKQLALEEARLVSEWDRLSQSIDALSAETP